jgi:hypothetical protein
MAYAVVRVRLFETPACRFVDESGRVVSTRTVTPAGRPETPQESG